MSETAQKPDRRRARSHVSPSDLASRLDCASVGSRAEPPSRETASGASACAGIADAAVAASRETRCTGDTPRRPAAWVEIDLGALRHNLALARRSAGGRRVIAVVKADAYGHGVSVIAPALAAAGVDGLAVATLAEAIELRALGLTMPVLVLQGLVHADDADAFVAHRLTPAVGRVESLAPLAAAARRAGTRLDVQLKLDTGMGRLGLACDELDGALDPLIDSQDLHLDGMLTQLAEADDPDAAATPRQRERFAAAIARARDRGLAPRWLHADPSAALLHGPTDVATAVRPGLMLYGADPTLDRVAAAAADGAGSNRLRPVMTVRCEVIHAKWVPAGARIGYGGTYVAPIRTRILTLPVGYADGLPRAAGGRIQLALGTARAPLVGRVSMDLATVDAGPESAADVGDVVCIFGAAQAGVLPVESLAAAVGTIPYEILTGIGARLPRLSVS